MFLGWAASAACAAKTIKTVAPKENMIQFPADVLSVRNAKTPITIAAEAPETKGSKFFEIFIYFFIN